MAGGVVNGTGFFYSPTSNSSYCGPSAGLLLPSGYPSACVLETALAAAHAGAPAFSSTNSNTSHDMITAARSQCLAYLPTAAGYTLAVAGWMLSLLYGEGWRREKSSPESRPTFYHGDTPAQQPPSAIPRCPGSTLCDFLKPWRAGSDGVRLGLAVAAITNWLGAGLIRLVGPSTARRRRRRLDSSNALFTLLLTRMPMISERVQQT